MIHATRSFLLNDLVDPRRKPPMPHPMIAEHIQKCIDAAEDAMTLVDGLGKQGILIQSFWFTHHVVTMAILVVYIYTIQQHRMSSLSASPAEGIWDPGRVHYLFSLAESCHRHLAEATRENSPSRRYSIILEELRREVHRQIGSHLKANPHLTAPDNAEPKPPLSNNFMDQKPLVPTTVSQPMSLDTSAPSYPPVSDILPVPDLEPESFNPSDEIGFFENLEGSNWWSQLDSWVSVTAQVITGYGTDVSSPGFLKPFE